MIESKITLRKLLVLGGEVYFYSFIFLVIVLAFLRPSNISPALIGQSLLPLSHNGYWFVTCYFVLMLFSPFLNKCIKALSQKTLLKVIFLSVLLWSIFPTILP